MAPVVRLTLLMKKNKAQSKDECASGSRNRTDYVTRKKIPGISFLFRSPTQASGVFSTIIGTWSGYFFRSPKPQIGTSETEPQIGTSETDTPLHIQTSPSWERGWTGPG